MNKIKYVWEQANDVFYVKVYYNEDYCGVLTFTEEAFSLFQDTAFSGQCGLHNEAPVIFDLGCTVVEHENIKTP